MCGDRFKGSKMVRGVAARSTTLFSCIMKHMNKDWSSLMAWIGGYVV